MTLMGFFVKYIFTYGILPLFIIFFIGKPLFLIKILSKFLYLKINNIQVFHFVIVLFGIFDLYFFYSSKVGQYAVDKLIKNEIVNPEEYSIRVSQVHSDERNIYIFLTCIAMIFTIHKFGERHIRIDTLEKDKEEKEKILGKNETGKKSS